MTQTTLNPTQLASLVEMVLQARFKSKFRVQFHQMPILFGFVMRLHFETEDGSWVQLDTEYEETFNEAEILNEELYARIALMR